MVDSLEFECEGPGHGCLICLFLLLCHPKPLQCIHDEWIGNDAGQDEPDQQQDDEYDNLPTTRHKIPTSLLSASPAAMAVSWSVGCLCARRRAGASPRPSSPSETPEQQCLMDDY